MGSRKGRSRRIDPQAALQPPSLLRRMLGGLVKAAGLVAAVSGVAFVSTHWLLTVVGVVVGLGLMILGSTLSPGPGTGAFTARYTMEVGGSGDIHYVKPPGGNVSDPMPGKDGRRFTGR